jgi:hypothetical protein
MPLPTVAEQDKFIVVKCIKAFNWAKQAGVLTDALILPLTTVAGLRALFTPAAYPAQASQDDIHQLRVCAESVDQLDNTHGLGILTNTNVASADTYAGLLSVITTAAALSTDELDDTARQDGAYWANGNALPGVSDIS